MNIPPKYEDVVAKVAEFERRESDLMEKIARVGRVSFSFFEDLDAALAREAALREELEKFKAGCVDLSSQVRELEHKMDYYKGEGLRADALQQRLTVAEKLLRETSDYLDGSTRNAVWCDSILHKKMRAALKPAEEGEGS